MDVLGPYTVPVTCDLTARVCTSSVHAPLLDAVGGFCECAPGFASWALFGIFEIGLVIEAREA